MRLNGLVLLTAACALTAAAQEDRPALRVDVRADPSGVQALAAGLARHSIRPQADAEYVLEGHLASGRGQLTLRFGRRVIWERKGAVPSPGAELLGSEAGAALVSDWEAERRIDLSAVDVSYPQLRRLSRALAALPQLREQRMWRYENGTAEFDLLTRRTPHAGNLVPPLEALELDGLRLKATVVDEAHLRVRILPPPEPAPATDGGTGSTP